MKGNMKLEHVMPKKPIYKMRKSTRGGWGSDIRKGINLIGKATSGKKKKRKRKSTRGWKNKVEQGLNIAGHYL